MASPAEADLRVTESCPRGLSAPNNYSRAYRDDSVPGLVPPGMVSATFGTAVGSFWTSPAPAPGPAGEPSSTSWKYPGGLSLVPRRAVGSALRSFRGGNVGRKAREDGFPLTSNDSANVWLVDQTGPSLKVRQGNRSLIIRRATCPRITNNAARSAPPMTSVSQWIPKYNRLKATISTPATTNAVARARTIRLRPIPMHTAMIPSNAPVPVTCPDGNGWGLALNCDTARVSASVAGGQRPPDRGPGEHSPGDRGNHYDSRPQ